MAMFDLFSKRQKRLRGEIPDVYEYDTLTPELRVQIVHVWSDSLGTYEEYHAPYGPSGPSDTYLTIVNALCREYGLFYLSGSGHGPRDYRAELINFFLREENVERVIDVIELTFLAIDRITRNYDYLHRKNADEIADQSIAELNDRLREHGVGYRYESGEMIRIDSELLHRETTRPAIRLLSSKLFAGAQVEFLRAHDHYRKGRPKEALNDALNALESTLKAICDRRGWSYPANATSKRLLDICFAERLIPAFWQSNMGGLRSILEGGVPTARNKLGGHGQGAQVVDVPEHIVSYVLHMTAAAIVFLVQADEDQG